VARLESAGYRVSTTVLAILEELGGKDLSFRTAPRRATSLDHFRDPHPLISCIQNERIRFCGHLGWCRRPRRREAETVNCSWLDYLRAPVVRCGISLRRSYDAAPDVTGRSVLFADEGGRLFELKAFRGGPYFEGYRSVGDFLAMKCLPLDELDRKQSRDALIEIPEPDDDDKPFREAASLVGVME
jgi:hypothetical protein